MWDNSGGDSDYVGGGSVMGVKLRERWVRDRRFNKRRFCIRGDDLGGNKTYREVSGYVGDD